MAAIQIQLLTGAGAGRRAAFSASPITFGRDADNTLVVTDAFVSRHHGALSLDEQEQWVLVNQSPNGTEVSGHQVTTKPRRLRDQDVIAVGGQAVFKVTLGAAPAEADPDAAAKPAAAAHDGGPSLSRRAKVWTGIGIYAVVVLVLGVVLFSIFGKTAGRGADAEPPALLPKQIADEIGKEPERQAVNEEIYRQALEEARKLHTKLPAEPNQILPAYRAYQRALAYSGKSYLDSTDQLDYFEVRDKLINEIKVRYESAYVQLKSQDYRGAADAFARLSEYYSEPGSPIFKNVKEMERYAQHRRGK